MQVVLIEFFSKGTLEAILRLFMQMERAFCRQPRRSVVCPPPSGRTSAFWKFLHVSASSHWFSYFSKNFRDLVPIWHKPLKRSESGSQGWQRSLKLLWNHILPFISAFYIIPLSFSECICLSFCLLIPTVCCFVCFIFAYYNNLSLWYVCFLLFCVVHALAAE